jgi:hypothetical protein
MDFAKLLMSQMLGVGKKSLVILMRNSEHFGEALMWMFLMISVGVNPLIFNIQG